MLFEELEKNIAMDCGYSWLVLSVAFIGQAMSVGFYYCYGTIFAEILSLYDASESQAAWIGSVGYSVCFMFGFLSSILCDRYGCCFVMSIGGAFLGLGVLTSSFAPNLLTLFVTYGIITSIGTSCLFFSSLLVLPLYFKKKLGLANGIASAGSGVGGMTLSPFFGYLIKSYGLQTTFQVYAVFATLPLAGGFLIRRKTHSNDHKPTISSCFDRTLLNNKAFVLFTMTMSIILFAYYIPFVHLINFSCIKGVSHEDAALLPSIIAATSAIGKCLFGYLSQRRGVNHLYMFQGYLLALSVSLTMLPLAANFTQLAFFSIVYGINEGGFACCVILCASQTVYSEQLATAFGMMYTVTSFFSLFGAPFAGVVFDLTGEYQTVFMICGAILMVAVMLMFFIPFLISEDVYNERKKRKHHVVHKQMKMTENEGGNPVIVMINYEDDVGTWEYITSTKPTPLDLHPSNPKINFMKDSIYMQNSSISGEDNSRYSQYDAEYGSTSTLQNIIKKYLNLRNMRKTKSMFSIPPFASQEYINKYTIDNPVVV